MTGVPFVIPFRQRTENFFFLQMKENQGAKKREARGEEAKDWLKRRGIYNPVTLRDRPNRHVGSTEVRFVKMWFSEQGVSEASQNQPKQCEQRHAKRVCHYPTFPLGVATRRWVYI